MVFYQSSQNKLRYTEKPPCELATSPTLQFKEGWLDFSNCSHLVSPSFVNTNQQP